MSSLKDIVVMYQTLKREWDKKPQNLDRCGELLAKLKVDISVSIQNLLKRQNVLSACYELLLSCSQLIKIALSPDLDFDDWLQISLLVLFRLPTIVTLIIIRIFIIPINGPTIAEGANKLHTLIILVSSPGFYGTAVLNV